MTQVGRNMNFPPVMILSMICLLLLLHPLLGVESSSLSHTTSSIINTTKDSSPDCPDYYGVGIYFAKSPYKTLVWSSNRYYDKQSLVLFTDEGKLVLRSLPNNKEKPFISTIHRPISYARMLDNGNFVLYGAGSEIVWQSFDHPTDTILSGQSLRSRVDLISGGSRLSIQEINSAVAIHTKTSECVISYALEGLLRRPVILNLNTAGQLYVVGSDGVALKYLHRNKNQQEEGSTVEEGVHMYIARLDSTGHFSLYKERIDGNVSDHEEYSVLVQSWPEMHSSSAGICLFCWADSLLVVAFCRGFLIAGLLIVLI